jgi:acyl-CoA thioesterase FadM
MKNTSFLARHVIQKNGETICEMHVTLVCVDTNTIRPISLPEILRTKLQSLLEE